MSKYVFALAFLVFLSLYSNDVSAALIDAANCSQVAVQEAINNAGDGDTVIVPSGSCTWSNTLIITNGINLMGAGIGNTTITAGSSNTLIQYNPSNYTLDSPFRLSGFSFNQNEKARALSLGYSHHIAPFTVQTKIRIDHNRFYGVASNDLLQAIWNYGGMYGVVDNNVFEIPYPIRNDAVGGSSWWDFFNYTPGSFDNLYFEDNTFTSNFVLADCQFSARYAMRYNSFTLNADMYSALDLHGNQGSDPNVGMYACFGAEIYGNKFISGPYRGTLYSGRGGQSHVYYNNIIGTRDSFHVKWYEDYCRQISPTSGSGDQDIHDSYAFGNRLNNSGALRRCGVDETVNCSVYGDYDGKPQVNREFFCDTGSNPFVSCGTLDARPSTCTTGQAYWATSQSCSDLTGMTGANPATPISGTLYKCTAPDIWTAHYTPYIYPHPLTQPVCGDYIVEGGEECDDGNQVNGDGCDSNCHIESVCQPGEQYKIINSTHITACNCSQQSVQAAIDAANDGDTVMVPAGTCSWTSQVSWTAPADVTLRGAGTTAIGGGDQTVIEDDSSANAPILRIKVNSTGTFTMVGITLRSGSGGVRKDHGLFVLKGPGTVNLGYLHLDTQSYPINNRVLEVNNIVGVLHHSILDLYSTSAIYVMNSGTDGMANDVWAQPTGFGTANFFFVENCLIRGTPLTYDTRVADLFWGGKIVIRFNTIEASCGYEVHATGSWVNERGARAAELYHNTFGQGAGQTEPNRGFTGFYSGCALVWGNAADGVFKQPYHGRVVRANDVTYSQNPTPDGWGYCGTDFNGIGSDWDGGTALGTDTTYGYPCLDQPGRGIGDLVTGSQPNKVNSETGTIHWPNQALEPIYIWNNTDSPAHGWGDKKYTFDTNRIVADRDYYPQANSIQTSPTSPFNGTSGTGWGSLANRPTTCTTGVGYWATDQGEWNSLNPGPDGQLYKCISTNNWEKYYNPYIYPHPLTVAPFATEICEEGEISSECWCQGLRTSGYCCHGYYGTEDCTTGAAYHRADNNPQDGCITMQELAAFINLWKQDSANYPMHEMMEAISLWKAGAGC